MKRWMICRFLLVGMLWTMSEVLPVQAAPAPSTLPLPVATPAATASVPVSSTATASATTAATASTPVVANPDMVCPVLSDEKADTKYAKVYEGKIYYLCCARCVTQFSADPKRYITEMESRSKLYAASDKPAETASSESSPASVSDVISSVASNSKPEPVLSDEARLYRFIGYFHPLLVHFPIALIISAALAECLLGFTGRRFFAPISLFSIRLAAFLIVLTAFSGWVAAGGNTDTSSSAWVLDWHRWFGIGTAIWTVLVATISLWITHESERGFYRWTLYLAAIAVGVTGHLGGMLVYGLNYFQW